MLLKNNHNFCYISAIAPKLYLIIIDTNPHKFGIHHFLRLPLLTTAHRTKQSQWNSLEEVEYTQEKSENIDPFPYIFSKTTVKFYTTSSKRSVCSKNSGILKVDFINK